MKFTLQLEYIALLILGVYTFSLSHFSWWWFIGLFFLPDIFMFGYLINNKIGAFFYNLAHHTGLAIIIGIGGFATNNELLIMIGSILLAHSAFDRILGYGLKYEDSFKNTHLGKIGK